MKHLAALFFCLPLVLAAQSPQVPHKMNFAGMTLHLHEDARKEIQKDVDMLTRYPKYFNIKVERAKTYFPVIERIFEEEKLPDDFKYLVIQESALIPDAVSVSDAVGFWQFKDFTAAEMGLRVDKEVDERMNIVASTRAAARYIKKNNFFFNNWLYALQAYQMGAGGVMKSVKDSQSGAFKMDITSKTYWYVKKYLAHKIAFEDAIRGKGELTVTFIENKEKQSVNDLAKALAIEENELREYNKWIKKNHIPGDKVYAVTIPYANQDSGKDPLAALTSIKDVSNPARKAHGQVTPSVKSMDRIKINGVIAAKANEGETLQEFADRNEVSLSNLIKSNDIQIGTKLHPGEYYFLKSKRTRADQAYHKVNAGEDLWVISQLYGVKLKSLLKFNRIKSAKEIKPGQTLWLASYKPKNQTNADVPKEIVEVNLNESFAWAADPQTPSTEDKPVTSTKVVPDVPTKINTLDVDDRGLPEILPQPKEDSLDGDLSSKNINPASSVAVKSDNAVVEKTNVEVDSLAVAEKADNESIIVVPKQDTTQSSHTVKSGETLYGISKLYGVGVMDLVSWNNLKIQDGIRPGQVLRLSKDPSASPAAPDNETKNSDSISTSEVIHEVKGSDTLYGIARKYGVTIKELMDWNNKKEFHVAVGEKLKVLIHSNN